MSGTKAEIRNPNSEIPTGERAFTLVEVLLTIAILATAMTIISSVLVSSIEARDRIEESIARYEVGPAILRIMTDDI
ncbi:MAG: type II secretion system protein, partial [Planctomycetota bacterium]|nr:type II secretion system protein [Planctomycetota bacterium]